MNADKKRAQRLKLLEDHISQSLAEPEVEFMQQIEALRKSLEGAPDSDGTRAGRQRLSEMQQLLALRLEKLRSSGTL